MRTNQIDVNRRCQVCILARSDYVLAYETGAGGAELLQVFPAAADDRFVNHIN